MPQRRSGSDSHSRRLDTGGLFHTTSDAMTTPSESTEVRPIAGALIGLPRVLEVVGLGRTAWLDRVRAKTAPQPIKLGKRTLWLEAEVAQFVADCVRRHREGASA